MTDARRGAGRGGSRTHALTRRRLLAAGLGGAAVVITGGGELVAHGILPGRQTLDEIDGACSVAGPPLTVGTPGPTRSESFASAARRRTVGYTIAWPPGHGPGSRLPLVISLHGFGGNHESGLGDISLARALAARASGRALPPMALVAVDGGGGYWNPHPGDDPAAMITDELIPLCRRQGLGTGSRGLGLIGISMGGFGALYLAERHPETFGAVAAISPAVWTSYDEAHAANAGAFASAADFARDDLITHAGRLAGLPVRIASGNEDPFHTGVVALTRVLPRSAVVQLTDGCHDGSFFGSQQHQSLAFVGAHLRAV